MIPIRLDGESPAQYAYAGLLDPEYTSVDLIRGLHVEFGLDWPKAIATVKQTLADMEEEIRADHRG